MTRAIRFPLTIAAVALLAGCSDQGTSQTSAQTGTPPGTALAVEIAACPLLAREEVAAAVERDMFAGEEGSPIGGGAGSGRMTSCAWKEDLDGPAPTLVTLLVWSWPPGSGGATNYLASFRKAAQEYADLPEPEPIALGEEALWDGTSLHARTGDVSFSIGVSKPESDPAEARAASETLAQAVLGALP